MWWNFVVRSRDELDRARRQWEDGAPRFGRLRSPLPHPGPQAVLAAADLDVFPVSVVDEDRHRGQAAERGMWSAVIVGPQPAAERSAAFAIGAV